MNEGTKRANYLLVLLIGVAGGITWHLYLPEIFEYKTIVLYCFLFSVVLSVVWMFSRAMARVVGLVFLIFVLIFSVYAGYYGFLYYGFEGSTAQDGALTGVRSGTFGDAFGVINALFSGLAFAGVLITLFLQRKDMDENQAELVRQQEEDQFYSMLRLQQDVVKSFDLQGREKGATYVVANGRDCFRTWWKLLGGYYSDSTLPDESDKIREAYRDVWDNHRGDLGLYFRSLYSLFRFLSECKRADKKKLGGVARSLISDYELVILFYNCVSTQGHKFRRYAGEFALFDNLEVTLLLDVQHVSLMDKDAFGGNGDALAMLG